MNIRENVTRFYARVHPVKLLELEAILESFHDDENGLIDGLSKKYQTDFWKVVNENEIQSFGDLVNELEALFSEKKNPNTESFLQKAAFFVQHVLDHASAKKCTLVSYPAAGVREDNLVASEETVQKRKEDDKSVHNIFPLDFAPAEGVISAVIREKCSSGDTLLIHPGTYKDNILLSKMSLNIQVATRERPVIIIPTDANVPIVIINEGASFDCSGILFSGPSDRAAAACIPLMVAEGACSLKLESCTMEGGGGGLIASGEGTNIHISTCSFVRCSFSGIFVKSFAKACVLSSSFIECEVGLRIKDSLLKCNDCIIEKSHCDGITCHGSTKLFSETTTFVENGDNGVMLSPLSQATFQRCVFKMNKQYGLYVPSGAEYSSPNCLYSSNGMGQYNRPPPSSRLILIEESK